ncbi:MAG: hypothetical protein WCJ19_02390 [bacterium]
MNISKFLTKKDWINITYLFLITRILVLFISIVGYSIFPQRGEVFYRRTAVEAVQIENIWNKFDSPLYEKLANEGYPNKPFNENDGGTWGFMPLYSMIIKGVSPIFANNNFITGIVISNIFTYIALLFIYKLLKEKFGSEKKAIKLLLISAGSFYLSIIYSEGLFLLLTALVFYFTHRKNYSLALFFAGLGAITRIQGGLLFIIPLLEIIFAYKWKFYKYIPIFLLSLIPLFCLMFYLQITCGEPLAFIKIQTSWGSPQTYPLQGFLAFVKGTASMGAYLNTMFWIFFGYFIISKHKILPISYIAFCIAFFLLSTSNETVYGTIRYTLPLIPLYIAASHSTEREYNYYLLLNVMFLSIAVTAFVTSTPTLI